jgi:hypothetical protein
MDPEKLARFRSLVDWLDGELARRPTLLATGQGIGITQLVHAARVQPASVYRTITAALPAILAVSQWTEQGEAPEADAFAILGEPER